MVRRGSASQQGSVLLGALMLLFVLSILGIALFDTALIDSQLAVASVDDHRALESAEAGMQRALHRLYRHLCGDDPACVNPSPHANWGGATIDGAAMSGAAFAPFISPTTSFQGTFADPRGAGFPSAEYSGTYAVEVKQITSDAAKTELGLGCPDAIAAAGGDPTCPGLLYVRSRGTFGRTAGEQISQRVVQAVVQARALGAGAGSLAILAETIIGTGSAEVHGSLHLTPCSAPPCSPLVLSAGLGIRNNYNGLPGALQQVVPRLPVVTCQPGTACAGFEVETLEATLRIGKPPTDETISVNIASAGESVGEAGSGTVNAVTGVRGKPTMDGVYLGHGCAATGVSPPCSDVVGTNPGNVYADLPIRADNWEPPPRLSRLDDPFVLGVTQRADYAACSGPGICNTSGTAVSGSGNDFLISYAFRILSDTEEDPRPFNNCQANVDGEMFVRAEPLPFESCGPPRNLYSILTATTPMGSPIDCAATPSKCWTQSTPTFRKTFRCTGPWPVTCDLGGVRVSGSVQGPAAPPSPYGYLANPAALMIEWRGADWEGYVPDELPELVAQQKNTLRIYACADESCGFAVTPEPWKRQLLAPWDLSRDVVYPLLIYVDGPLKICPGCSGQLFFYHGNALVLAKGVSGTGPSIAIDTVLVAGCFNDESPFNSSPVGNSCVVPQSRTSFPQRSLLTLYTPGNVSLFDAGTPLAQATVMGRFQANKIALSRPIHFLGTVSAKTIDVGSHVPRFWQVRLPLTPTALPSTAPLMEPARGSPRWSVAPLKWKECTGPQTDQPC